MSANETAPVSPSVCVVILNWNGTEDTLKCLRSLEHLRYPTFSILVVENGSKPETLGPLRGGLGAATLLEISPNLGFAGGANRGIDWALHRGAEYVFLLNNDTVVDPDCLTALVEIAERDPSVGIVGAVNFYLSKPDVIWYSGGMVDWRSGTFCDPTSEKTLAQLIGIPSIREVDDVAGSSLLIKASVIRAIGLMDLRYFLNYEDTDWCFRAKRAGYKVLASLEAKIWHKVSAATGTFIRYFAIRNRGLFMLRHCPRRRLPGFLWRHFRAYLGEARQAFRSGNQTEGIITLIALRDFVLARFHEGSMERVRELVGAGVTSE